MWATYEGGGVRVGTLVASVDDNGELDLRYSHVNDAGTSMTGECKSIPKTLPETGAFACTSAGGGPAGTGAMASLSSRKSRR